MVTDRDETAGLDRLGSDALLQRALIRDPTRLAALFDLARSLSQTRDLDEVLVRFGDRAMGVTGGFWSSVSYFDTADGTLRTLLDQSASGDGEPLGDPYDVAMYPATHRVLAACQPAQVRVDDASADPAERSLLVEMGCGAVLMLPLVTQGTTIGLVEVYSQTPRTFEADDVAFCQLLCDIVAAAVQNALLYDRMRTLADTDPLTRLWNRRVFDLRLAEVIADESLLPVSLAILDVDGLKVINDSLGHPAGDRALLAVSSVLRDTIRTTHLACRLGGDEFGVIMPCTTALRARSICRLAVRKMEQSDPPARFSVGIATATSTALTAGGLYQAADRSAYRAKRRRRRNSSASRAPRAA